MTAQELSILKGMLTEGGIYFTADPTAERVKFEELFGSFPADPSVATETRQIGEVPGTWMAGAGTGVVLYLHGGGYTLGSSTSYRSMATSIARAADSALFSIDYRRAPEAVFPAALDDALAAYRGLLSEGFSGNQIVVVGDSAGGGLALALLSSIRDSRVELPAAAALLSPWTDLALSGTTMLSKSDRDVSLTRNGLAAAAQHYLGSTSATDPAASPLFADLRGLPPLLIEVGEAEILLADSTRLASSASEAGVEVRLHVWPGMVHDWPLFAFMLSEGREAIDEIGEFIAQQLAGGVTK